MKEVRSAVQCFRCWAGCICRYRPTCDYTVCCKHCSLSTWIQLSAAACSCVYQCILPSGSRMPVGIRCAFLALSTLMSTNDIDAAVTAAFFFILSTVCRMRCWHWRFSSSAFIIHVDTVGLQHCLSDVCWEDKRLCYCRGTARRAMSVEILWPFFDWAIDKKLC